MTEYRIRVGEIAFRDGQERHWQTMYIAERRVGFWLFSLWCPVANWRKDPRTCEMDIKRDTK